MAYQAAHQAPKGPGDARPTALDIVRNQNLVGKLTGKTILITGGTAGLGLETARALYATGAHIFITSRSADKGIQAAKELSSPSGLPVEAIEMQLDSFASIRSGAADFLRKSNGLNIMICNAGVMMCPEGKTKDGFEVQFGVNHLSHFLLFQLLKDTLIKSSSPEFASRVISLSSCAHRGGPLRLHDYNFEQEPYNAGSAYGQAKTANLYFANELDRRFGTEGVHALSVHPGLIHTSLERHVVDNPMAQEFINNPETSNLWKSPEQGAATSVWAAIAKDWEGKGGRYLEDVREAEPWDPETEFPNHAPGYAPHAYDNKAAAILWDDSMVMVGAQST